MMINGGQRGPWEFLSWTPTDSRKIGQFFNHLPSSILLTDHLLLVELCSAVLVLVTGAEYFPIMVTDISGAHTFGFPTK